MKGMTLSYTWKPNYKNIFSLFKLNKQFPVQLKYINQCIHYIIILRQNCFCTFKVPNVKVQMLGNTRLNK